MFNFLASLNYLLVNWLRPADSMASRVPSLRQRLPAVHELMASAGRRWPSSPLNLSLLLALAACVFVWWFLWKSAAGFGAGRLVAAAALYARHCARRHDPLAAMAVSGALAGLVGINGSRRAGQMTLDFVASAGFTGIACSLMGRNHPVGIVLATLLFGVLYQGGVEVSLRAARLLARDGGQGFRV